MVWASLFGELAIERPAWIGANPDLWEDLGRMEQHFASGSRERAGALVAVTWARFAAEPEGDVGPYVEPTNPTSLDADWTRLGYDVADGSLLSGLMNCGYDDERPTLQARFAGLLNEHHLFSDVSGAAEYRLVCDLRVTEHAPFFVFGLYVRSLTRV
jgi:hypothetical protein